LIQGVALQKAGQLQKAEAIYKSVLSQAPASANALNLLATVEHARGALDRAEELIKRALAIQPDGVEYLNTLGTILGDAGRHGDAALAYREALRISPHALRPRSNLLFLLNLMPGVTRDEFLSEHLAWSRIHADPLMTEIRGFERDGGNRSCDRGSQRLRIGYVSGDFWGGHPVGRIISSVLPRHDREAHEIFCYDNTRAQDDVRASLRGSADSWIEVRDMDDGSLAERIREDRIDVLVDLSGHTRNNRLLAFARRPAPVQVSWLGYLNTTGMRAIDWRLVTPYAELPGAEAFHTERLWYLGGPLWPWIQSQGDGWVAPQAPPSAREGHITFGSFNAFPKLNQDVIATWAEILRALPGAQLRVYGAPGGTPIERTLDQFESAGVAADRIGLFGKLPYERYVAAYREVDIALDTFPYSGGATTCESLWLGVPVVALAGAGGFARTSASFLHALGLDNLVAQSGPEYVSLAVNLAKKPAQIAAYRRELTPKLLDSTVADPALFVRGLEQAFRGMYERRLQPASIAAGER
jgi:predicted O-linked N-acetylglucosamine transferase (SPINDLY family)